MTLESCQYIFFKVNPPTQKCAKNFFCGIMNMDVDEKLFCLILKTFFCSWDIKIFVLTSWLINGLIRKFQNLRSHSPDNKSLQWNKGKQRKKFSQLLEYNMRNTSLEKSCTKCGGVTSPRSLLFFKKKLYIT